MESVIITGNTYPVRDALVKLGGKWDKVRKGWIIPIIKEAEAKRIVATAPKEKNELSHTDIIALAVRKRGGTPGICFSCGGKCKYPYAECWDCKEERKMGY